MSCCIIPTSNDEHVISLTVSSPTVVPCYKRLISLTEMLKSYTLQGTVTGTGADPCCDLVLVLVDGNQYTLYHHFVGSKGLYQKINSLCRQEMYS